MSAIAKPAASAGADAEKQEGEDFFPGDCSATSESEHSKISLAALRTQAQGEGAQAQQLLLGLLADPKLASHFSKDDKSGTHADSPAELVAAIIDWIDADKNETGSSAGDEDRHYAYLHDSYKAKNAPFDSVSELQLVHGIDDQLFSLLKDRVSIYNTSPQLELAGINDVTLFIGLCSLLPAGGCAQLYGNGPFWTKLQELRLLAPLSLATLGTLLTAASVPVDAQRLGTVFADRNSTTFYTIEAEGSLGNAHKRIRAVLQTYTGQLFYFRVE
jgi:hypothetical protein